MKKLITLLAVLTIVSGCKEEVVQGFNDLSPAGQAAVLARGRADCLAREAGTFNNYKTRSATVFTTNANYVNSSRFNFTFKNGTSTEKTVEAIVWKRTASEIFFYVNDSRENSGYFLRILKTDNEEMIDDMLDAHCARPNIYTTSTGSGGPLRITNEYTLTRAPNTEEYDDVYTLNFSDLAYFANFNVTRTKIVKDVDLRQVGSTETFTSTLVRDTVVLVSTDPTSTSYDQKYCVIHNGSPYRLSRSRGIEGFDVDLSDAVDCVGAKPAAWNMTI